MNKQTFGEPGLAATEDDDHKEIGDDDTDTEIIQKDA